MPCVDTSVHSLSDQECLLILNSSHGKVKCLSPVDFLLNGNYKAVLEQPTIQRILSCSGHVKNLSEYLDHVRHHLKIHLESSDNDQLLLLTAGVAVLLSFCQVTMTGPMLDWNPILLFGLSHLDQEKLEADSAKYLSLDGEDIYALTPEPLLFVLARVILVESSHLFTKLAAIHWWSHRTAFVHQRLLDEPVESLKAQLEKSYEKTVTSLASLDLHMFHDDIYARLHLEHGLTFHYYSQDKEAVSLYAKSQEASRLKWSLSGALGKRTKFQTFDVSQLVIVAESHNASAVSAEEKKEPENGPELPTTMDLNDDVLLETIEFSRTQEDKAPEAASQGKLREIDQCILLAHCLNVKNTNPSDGLTTEEMFPYVRRVLENPNNWMIHTMALLLRSRLESNKSRTVERGCLQLQALVDQFGVHDSSAAERMMYLFSIAIPMKWEMERELGDRLVSLGVIRSALEIYTRLHLWEDAISCHQMLEQPQKAEKLVLDLLEKSPDSAKLWCILGDIRGKEKKSDDGKEDAIELYEKAWRVSGGRYARAMRSLGAHYYRTQEWEKCIESYTNALRINALFENSWFVLGCAAMQLADSASTSESPYDTASMAFTRCTSLDPENSEAWNNLASVFIKQKKLREAFQAFKAALRYSYEASNIWENYLYVCADLREYKEAIRAAERVFMVRVDSAKMKHRAVDIPVLDVLVSAVENNITSASGESAQSCAKQLEALLEKITSRISSPQLYTLSARVLQLNGKYSSALEHYQRSYRALLNDAELNDKREVFEALCQGTKELVEAFERLGSKMEVVRMGSDNEEEIVCKDWVYQSKMAVKAVIGRTKQTYEGTPEFEEISDKLKSLKSL